MEPDERPIGGQLARLERPARVVADDQRRLVLAQQRVDVRPEPALVAELERVPAGRDPLQGSGQPLVVALEVRRQLPEDRPELVALDQRRDRRVVAVEPLLGRFMALRMMLVVEKLTVSEQ